MDDLITDFHIHSKYSYDSLLSPKSIVKRAKKVGLTCIAITDHGTIRGGVEGKKFALKYGVEVIVGAEIKTDCGDIIGLNLNNEIEVTDWQDVIRAIRSQGGIVVLPHPYRDHYHVEEIAQCVDFIEIWNARNNIEQNNLAEKLTNFIGKPAILGSDAHVYQELGNVKVTIDPASWKITEIINRSYSAQYVVYQSQLIRIIKHRSPGEFVKLGSHYLRNKMKNILNIRCILSDKFQKNER
jgi:hypothetical protein